MTWGRDPFGSSPPFEKTYGYLWKYIPKLTQDQVPPWLKKLVLRRFHGETTVEAMAAHSLYRQIFESNEHDCRSIPEMQRIGETIACFKPVKSNELCTSSAVSAITFVHREGAIIVLFLGTQRDYQQLGIAGTLLNLMLQTVRTRISATVKMTVSLLCNTKDQATPLLFYQKRGFVLLHQQPTFPNSMQQLFSNDKHEYVRNYLNEETNLVWLGKSVLEIDFIWKTPADPNANSPQPHYARFLTKPNPTTGDRCVYAAIDAITTITALDECKPDPNTQAHVTNLFSPNKFMLTTTDDDEFQPIHGHPKIYVTWVGRCFTKLGNSAIDSEVLEITLAWIQRRQRAPLWKKMFKIVPIYVCVEVGIMSALYEGYKTSLLIEKSRMVDYFHPVIDCQRFMDASIVVMKFLLGNSDLLSKNYIAFLHQAFEVGTNAWSCVIAVNAKYFMKPNNDGKAFGFVHFDPHRMGQNETFPQHLQLLIVMAIAILNWNKTPQSKPSPKKSTTTKQDVIVDSVVSQFYKTMEDFRKLVEIGCASMRVDTATNGEVAFPALNFPVQYVHCNSFHGKVVYQKKMSDAKCLLFLLDFIHAIQRNGHDSMESNGTMSLINQMGFIIPVKNDEQHKLVTRMLMEVQRCVLQVTDRISELYHCHIKESRTKNDEYKNYLQKYDMVGTNWIKNRKKVDVAKSRTTPKAGVATSALLGSGDDEDSVTVLSRPKTKEKMLSQFDDSDTDETSDDDVHVSTSKVAMLPSKSSSFRDDDDFDNDDDDPQHGRKGWKGTLSNQQRHQHAARLKDCDDNDIEDGMAVSKRAAKLGQKKVPKEKKVGKTDATSLVVPKKKKVVKTDATIKAPVIDLVACDEDSDEIKSTGKVKKRTNENAPVCWPTKKSRLDFFKSIIDGKRKEEMSGYENDVPSYEHEKSQPVITMTSEIERSLVRIFRTDYQACSTDVEKDSMLWRVLKIIHETTCVPKIHEALEIIRCELEEVEENVDAGEIPLVENALLDNEVRDETREVPAPPVHEIRVFLDYKPAEYREVTQEYVRHYSRLDTHADKFTLVQTIAGILREKNCEFYKNSKSDAATPIKMDELEVWEMIRERMRRAVRTLKKREAQLKENQSSNAVGSWLTVDGEPTERCVVCAKNKVKNAAHTYYRSQLLQKKNDYMNAKEEEKHHHACDVMTNVLAEGYIFVQKVDDNWSEMNERKILEKIKQGFRAFTRTRATKPNSTTCTAITNDVSFPQADVTVIRDNNTDNELVAIAMDEEKLETELDNAGVGRNAERPTLENRDDESVANVMEEEKLETELDNAVVERGNVSTLNLESRDNEFVTDVMEEEKLEIELDKAGVARNEERTNLENFHEDIENVVNTVFDDGTTVDEGTSVDQDPTGDQGTTDVTKIDDTNLHDSAEDNDGGCTDRASNNDVNHNNEKHVVDHLSKNEEKGLLEVVSEEEKNALKKKNIHPEDNDEGDTETESNNAVEHNIEIEVVENLHKNEESASLQVVSEKSKEKKDFKKNNKTKTIITRKRTRNDVKKHEMNMGKK